MRKTVKGSILPHMSAENGKKPNKGIKNLKPCHDTETAKARGKLGGIASGEAKREKKYISRILADYLQKEHDVEIRDAEGKIIDTRSMGAEELISKTVTAILLRGDSASKGIIDSIASITEGNNINLNATLSTSKMSREERKARIDALRAKLDR